VTKDKLNLALSGLYGFSIYQNKSITRLMDRDFMAVEWDTPVSKVSEAAMHRENHRIYDFIVVTRNGDYAGIVTIRDMLSTSFKLEVAVAKHQNPLTGLPGNLLIEQELASCVNTLSPYTVAYFDIDNFKAYNDVFGFDNGDAVIKLLANILQNNFSQSAFVGHVGGDDFIVVIKKHVDANFFKIANDSFIQEVKNLYPAKDCDNGFITAINRQGIEEKFPLATLTIVTTDNSLNPYKSASELAENLAAKKKKSKAKKFLKKSFFS
ncbi:MAG: GGDEF domain-containing protein, partial [Lentisphaeria bacterium]